MSGTIPFYDISSQHSEIAGSLQHAMQQVLHASRFIMGERLEAFESEYAKYIGVKHCIGVGNGLDALKISLKALGVGKGDEVLVPAHTYIATLLAVTDVGASPVLVEPDPATYTINLTALESKITPRTKALIPVHLYGRPVEMDAVNRIAEKYKLWVVEDNAQSTGSIYKDRKTGSWGILNAHSFYPTKNLGALGDGGAITTDNDDLAREVKLLRNYGSVKKYQHEQLGYNSRLDELQAAFLSVKLPYLEQWLSDKRALATQYLKELSTVQSITLPAVLPSYMRHSFHLFVIQCKERDRLMHHLHNRGIQTLVHYPIPTYRQMAYRSQFDSSAYPITDLLSANCLSLPLFPGMTQEQVKQVVSAIRQVEG